MWRHYCPECSGVLLAVERGMPCNWCDATEPEPTDSLEGPSDGE